MASASAKRPPSTSENEKGAIAKKRRRKPSISEEEDTRGSSSLPKYLAEPPMSKIYNSSFRNNKPAELFRKDLISAMKLPDNEQLSPEDYWLLADSWKQEWERGVQVPVNPEALPEANIRDVKSQEPHCLSSLCHAALAGVIRKKEKTAEFKLPKKFIRCNHDEFFSNDLHALVNVAAQAEKMCRYDLDDTDVQWLKLLNEEREDMGLPVVEESIMEKIMEELETQCFENLQEAIKSEKGVGIEYDEDVICDVCRSPDSEEGNEMVFCDSCNICVHQACYGITTIPEGSWVCCTCAFGIKPSCILCPNRGGAMKSTRSGQKWAHVSCALWIPEVSIGCVEKMEPITKISQIPASRWALVCCVCRERVGACIQCSVKTCKIAYHVTCAFKDGLAMKAIIDEENDEDGVKLRSYCEKHSKKKQGDESSDTDCGEGRRKKKAKSKKKLEISSSEDTLSVRKRRSDKNLPNQTSVSQSRMCEMESVFYNYVNINEAAEVLQVDVTVVDFVFQYWKLKRMSNFNKPLIMPKEEESDALGKQQEDSLYARMKMFVHLRQDLERVRNLCYMVSRREKLSRSWYRIREEVFQKQVEVIMDKNQELSEKELEAVIHANHGDSVYDQLFCWNNDITPSLTSLLSILDGSNINADLQAGANKLNRRQEKQQQTPQKLPNPYAKHYLNGMLSRSQRRISSLLPLSKDSSSCDGAVKLGDSSNEGRAEPTSVKTEGGETALSQCGSSAEPAKEKCEAMNKDQSRDDEMEVDVSSAEIKREQADVENEIVESSPSTNDSSQAKDVEVRSETSVKESDESVSGVADGKSDAALPKSNNLSTGSGKNVDENKITKDKDTNSCEAKSREVRKGTSSETAECKESARDVQAPSSPAVQSAQSEELLESLAQPTQTVIQNTFNTRLRSGKETAKVCGADTKKNSGQSNEKINNQKQKSFNLRKAPALHKEASITSSSAKEQRTPGNKSTKKDISPVKEKQREEDEKLRECLFSSAGSPRGSLSGYRIPKKARTDGTTGDSSETKKGGLTPLHEVSQPTVEYPENSYSRTRCAKGWNKESDQSAYAANGENQDQSTRLVIKLRKVPNYSNSQQWQRETDFSEAANTFKVVQNDWHAQTKKSERILRSDRRFLPPHDQQSHPPIPDPQTKENGSRCSRRFRNVPQKLSKSDIVYS